MNLKKLLPRFAVHKVTTLNSKQEERSYKATSFRWFGFGYDSIVYADKSRFLQWGKNPVKFYCKICSEYADEFRFLNNDRVWRTIKIHKTKKTNILIGTTLRPRPICVIRPKIKKVIPKEKVCGYLTNS